MKFGISTWCSSCQGGVEPQVVEVALHLLHLLACGFFGIALHACVDGGIHLQSVAVEVVAVLLAPALQVVLDGLAEVERLTVVVVLHAEVQLDGFRRQRVVGLLCEVAAVQRLWGEHKPGGALVGIGSVKGNIGHTLRASMAAGVAKAALALFHRVLPPQISPERPHESLANLASSAYLLDEARPWITGDSSSPRRAVVLGANFDAIDPVGTTSKGGRAAAIVLEEEPEDRL